MANGTPGVDAMSLAERTREFRLKHGMTQEDLASKSGLGIATIQRLERGQSASPGTIASVAAAFAVDPTVLTGDIFKIDALPTDPYFPLTEISSGKALIDLVAKSNAMDFDYMAIEDTALAELVARLYQLCAPNSERQIPRNPSERIRLDIEASKLLQELKSNGLSISGEIYERTAHEVLDDGDWPPMLMGKWDETCLVLRIGTDGNIVKTASVYEDMGKWTSSSDPKIVVPGKLGAKD